MDSVVGSYTVTVTPTSDMYVGYFVDDDPTIGGAPGEPITFTVEADNMELSMELGCSDSMGVDATKYFSGYITIFNNK